MSNLLLTFRGSTISVGNCLFCVALLTVRQCPSVWRLSLHPITPSPRGRRTPALPSFPHSGVPRPRLIPLLCTGLAPVPLLLLGESCPGGGRSDAAWDEVCFVAPEGCGPFVHPNVVLFRRGILIVTIRESVLLALGGLGLTDLTWHRTLWPGRRCPELRPSRRAVLR